MTRKIIIDKIKKIRAIRPDISITTDVIVGFPGETEEFFQETVQTIKKINFTKIHVFPYSDRKGTKASKMKNHVPENIKKQRVKKLLEISKESLELQIITGVATPEEEIKAGNRLCTEDLEKLNSVIQIMDSANSNELGNLITKINIENKQDYVLELKSEKKNVHLGDTSDIGTKMLYIKTVLENEKGKEGDIFVNTDLNNSGAIFREKV